MKKTYDGGPVTKDQLDEILILWLAERKNETIADFSAWIKETKDIDYEREFKDRSVEEMGSILGDFVRSRNIAHELSLWLRESRGLDMEDIHIELDCHCDDREENERQEHCIFCGREL